VWFRAAWGYGIGLTDYHKGVGIGIRWRLYDLIGVCLFLCQPHLVWAHGGGLDSNGCHNDRKRGGYHCHGGSSAPLPTTEVPKPLPLMQVLPSELPPAPIVTSSPNLPTPIEGPAQVLDGDTIQIGTTRIRLYGIDAFEAEQYCLGSKQQPYGCGGQATRALMAATSDHLVSCVSRGTDAFDRILAVCRVASLDLGSLLVRQGNALAYTRYALDYASDEQEAKKQKQGVWAGTFSPPWEYRVTRLAGAAESQRTAIAPSADCMIKGNVNRKGKRIYHLPNDKFYARIRPENWFCAIEEA
jgi:endonuclease YncB( thermonuclease family)